VFVVGCSPASASRWPLHRNAGVSARTADRCGQAPASCWRRSSPA
jgi:hypothetical protein